MNQLKNFLQGFNNFNLIDIGTGVGNFISIITSLTSDYSKITGIDTSERMIAVASKNFSDNDRIQFKVMDANHLDVDSESFDIVSLSNSLHHLSDISKTISEMERVVKCNGVILIHEMISDHLNELQISHRLLHHFAAEVDRELGMVHGETYTRDEIVDLLKKYSNFELLSYWPMDQGDTPEVTEEDLQGLIQLVDRVVMRVQDSPRFEYYKSKAEEIKKYILEHGYEGCTQMMYVLKKQPQN